MSDTVLHEPCWYAIRTRSRHEKVVNHQLELRGVEVFLPLMARRQRWKDRVKQVSFPLFPGYCFARFSPHERLAVLTAVGVVQIVGFNGCPSTIPPDEIETVKAFVSSGLSLDPYPYLKVGTTVEVIRGPLMGVRGIVVRKGKRARLVVGIELIQQAASVELDAEDVEPLGGTCEKRNERAGSDRNRKGACRSCAGS